MQRARSFRRLEASRSSRPDASLRSRSAIQQGKKSSGYIAQRDSSLSTIASGAALARRSWSGLKPSADHPVDGRGGWPPGPAGRAAPAVFPYNRAMTSNFLTASQQRGLTPFKGRFPDLGEEAGVSHSAEMRRLGRLFGTSSVPEKKSRPCDWLPEQLGTVLKVSAGWPRSSTARTLPRLRTSVVMARASSSFRLPLSPPQKDGTRIVCRSPVRAKVLVERMVESVASVRPRGREARSSAFQIGGAPTRERLPR